MNKKYLLAIAASTLMFAACGDEVTEIHQDGMAVLEAGLELSKQKCDSANVGEMLFVMDSSEAFICDGESWQTLKGEKGEDGGKGADGKDGEDGDNGNDGTSCTAQSVKNAAGLGGLEVTCEKIVIDTIWNGEKGENGNDGEDGVGCSVKDGGDGTVTVSCGEGKTTLYKAVCGTAAYDPAKSFCSEGEVYDLCGGKSYDPKKQFCKQGSTVEDYGWLTDARDEQNIQVYKTVKICNDDETSCLTWMAENLNYSVNPDEQSWCGGGEADTKNEGDCDLYGRLYTWAAAVGKSEDECGYGHECDLSDAKNEKGEVRGVCPEGWHLPSKDEWETLFAAVGGSSKAGTALKSQTGWKSQTGDAADRDAYGFSVLPAGYRLSNGYFNYAGNLAYFWSASQGENYSYEAYRMYLYYFYEDADLTYGSKFLGLSVRCLQN